MGRSVKKERIIEDYLDKRFYEKPSVRKRREKGKKIRNAKKEMREPQITIRCGSWRKGPCEKCNKKRGYVTEISDFMIVRA